MASEERITPIRSSLEAWGRKKTRASEEEVCKVLAAFSSNQQVPRAELTKKEERSLLRKCLADVDKNYADQVFLSPAVAYEFYHLVAWFYDGFTPALPEGDEKDKPRLAIRENVVKPRLDKLIALLPVAGTSAARGGGGTSTIPAAAVDAVLQLIGQVSTPARLTEHDSQPLLTPDATQHLFEAYFSMPRLTGIVLTRTDAGASGQTAPLQTTTACEFCSSLMGGEELPSEDLAWFECAMKGERIPPDTMLESLARLYLPLFVRQKLELPLFPRGPEEKPLSKDASASGELASPSEAAEELAVSTKLCDLVRWLTTNSFGEDGSPPSCSGSPSALLSGLLHAIHEASARLSEKELFAVLRLVTRGRVLTEEVCGGLLELMATVIPRSKQSVKRAFSLVADLVQHIDGTPRLGAAGVAPSSSSASMAEIDDETEASSIRSLLVLFLCLHCLYARPVAKGDEAWFWKQEKDVVATALKRLLVFVGREKGRSLKLMAELCSPRKIGLKPFDCNLSNSYGEGGEDNVEMMDGTSLERRELVCGKLRTCVDKMRRFLATHRSEAGELQLNDVEGLVETCWEKFLDFFVVYDLDILTLLCDVGRSHATEKTNAELWHLIRAVSQRAEAVQRWGVEHKKRPKILEFLLECATRVTDAPHADVLDVVSRFVMALPMEYWRTAGWRDRGTISECVLSAFSVKLVNADPCKQTEAVFGAAVRVLYSLRRTSWVSSETSNVGDGGEEGTGTGSLAASIARLPELFFNHKDELSEDAAREVVPLILQLAISHRAEEGGLPVSVSECLGWCLDLKRVPQAAVLRMIAEAVECHAPSRETNGGGPSSSATRHAVRERLRKGLEELQSRWIELVTVADDEGVRSSARQILALVLDCDKVQWECVDAICKKAELVVTRSQSATTAAAGSQMPGADHVARAQQTRAQLRAAGGERSRMASESTIQLFSADPCLRGEGEMALGGEAYSIPSQKQDFEQAAENLRGHRNDPRAAITKVATDTRSSSAAATTSSRSDFIETAATVRNLELVKRAAADQCPLLIQGATGVAKTATVRHAAWQCGKRLLRMNMSGSVESEDFFGKLSLHGSGEKLEFVRGPFARAFADGHWLMLDELNLAPAEILHQLEAALDQKQIVLRDPSCGKSEFAQVLQMHEQFRLFATQNPNAGKYRGKREKQSPAFLSHFRVVEFHELAREDSERVVAGLLGLAPVLPSCASTSLGRAGNKAPEPQAGENGSDRVRRVEGVLKRSALQSVAKLVVSFHEELQKRLAGGRGGGAGSYTTDGQPLVLTSCSPLSEVSFRNVHAWVPYLREELDTLLARSDADTSPSNAQCQFLAREAWHHYGGRVPKQLLREAIASVFHREVEAEAEAETLVDWDLTADSLRVGSYARPRKATSARDQLTRLGLQQLRPADAGASEIFFQMHEKMVEELLCKRSIEAYGAYRVDASWLWNWMQEAREQGLDEKAEEILMVGCAYYRARVRHPALKKRVEYLFAKAASENATAATGGGALLGTSQLSGVDAGSFFLSSVGNADTEDAHGPDLAGEEQHKGLTPAEMAFVKEARERPIRPLKPEMPFVLSQRILRAMEGVLRSLRNPQQPILVKGGGGCGASGLVEILTFLLGEGLTSICLTPETEVSALFGQFTPSSSREGQAQTSISWRDGQLTGAARGGGWVRLDNLQDCDAAVAERMNPVLEVPPYLFLAEKGGSEAEVPIAGSFQVLATMNGCERNEKKLSPAMANRFQVVELEDLLDLEEQRFRAEMRRLATAAGAAEKEAQDLAALVWSLCRCLRNNYVNAEGKITTRCLVSMVDCFSCLRAKLAGSATAEDVLFLALQFCVLSRFDKEATKNLLERDVPDVFEKVRRVEQKLDLVEALSKAREDASSARGFAAHGSHQQFQRDESATSAGRRLAVAPASRHVLTASRRAQAATLLCSVEMKKPVLLEGPAATGKTSSVRALADGWQGRTGSDWNGIEQVNNTESTTAQDYLGCWVHRGGKLGLEYQRGALVRALEENKWFLADELNLAPGGILSMLAPVLEGQRYLDVPGYGRVFVPEHFRFFATQNPTSYSGRAKLPPAIRGRFLEVQVADFPEDELVEILSRREYAGQAAGFRLPETDAKRLAKLYHAIKRRGGGAITLRSLIKWVERDAERAMASGAGGFALSPESGFLLLAQKIPVCEQDRTLPALGNSVASSGSSVSAPLAALRAAFEEAFEDRFPAAVQEQLFAPVAIKQLHPSGVEIVDAGVRFVLRDGARLDRSRHWQGGREPPQTFQRAFARIAFASLNAEPLLLYGPTGCKSEVLTAFAEVALTGTAGPLPTMHLTPETEAANLLGQLTPCSKAAALVYAERTAETVIARCAAFAATPGQTKNSSSTPSTQPCAASFLSQKKQCEQSLAEFAALAREMLEAEERKVAAMERAEKDAEEDRGAGFLMVDRLVREQKRAEQEAAHAGADDGFSGRILGQSLGGLDLNTSLCSSSLLPPLEPTIADVNALWGAALDNDPSPDRKDSDYILVDDDCLGEDEDRLSEGRSSDGASGRAGGGTGRLNQKGKTDAEFSDGLGDSSEEDEPMSGGRGTVVRDVLNSTCESFDVLTEMDALSPRPSQLVQSASLKSTDLLSASQTGRVPSAPAAEDSEMERKLMRKLDTLLKLLRQIAVGKDCELLLARVENVRAACFEQTRVRGDNSSSDVTFLFVDGPVTEAAQRGSFLRLEDFHLPSQAVTERINPVLEVENRVLHLTEDVTANVSSEIRIPPKFQVFATAHVATASSRLKLSPATLSRFTEIYVPAYSEEETWSIVKQMLVDTFGATGGEEMCRRLFDLRRLLELERSAETQDLSLDLRVMLRIVDFLCAQHKRDEDVLSAVSSTHKFLYVAVRHLVFDRCTVSVAVVEKLVAEWCRADADEETWKKIFLEKTSEASFVPLAASDLFEFASSSNGSRRVLFKGNSVAMPLKETPEHPITMAELQTRLYCCPTPTLLRNLSRIFVCLDCKAPLLLEGPPGTGKTEAPRQAAKLCRHTSERISCSASTTVEQLFGSLVPECQADGRRVFRWRDGALLRAVRDGSWIILDEINLAPPEVLDAVAPLLDRGIATFRVPGKDEVLRFEAKARFLTTATGGWNKGRTTGTDDTRFPPPVIFATQNPTSVGGGRHKLSRSIQNMFVTVKMDAYGMFELGEIARTLYAELPEALAPVMQEYLPKILEFHAAVQGKADAREIAPQSFNMRDLIKLRDVLRGCATDLLQHTCFYSQEQSASVWQKCLCRFTELVYAHRYQPDSKDFGVVAELARKLFSSTQGPQSRRKPKKSTEEQERDDDRKTAIDSSSPDYAQVGVVYLPKTRASYEDPTRPFVHVPETDEYLEKIAGACQSGRAVLLKGPTGSKASMVRKLAGLTGNALVEIPMCHSMEIGDLIGQLLPTAGQAEEAAELLAETLTALDEVQRHLLVFCLPSLSNTGGKRAGVREKWDRYVTLTKERLETEAERLCVQKNRCSSEETTSRGAESEEGDVDMGGQDEHRQDNRDARGGATPVYSVKRLARSSLDNHAAGRPSKRARLSPDGPPTYDILDLPPTSAPRRKATAGLNQKRRRDEDALCGASSCTQSKRQRYDDGLGSDSDSEPEELHIDRSQQLVDNHAHKVQSLACDCVEAITLFSGLIQEDLMCSDLAEFALRKNVDFSRQLNLLRRRWERLRESSAASGTEAASAKMGFQFVEAALVQALRRGDWVLLRHINCAPPEIVERLNSLVEDCPSLNLFEVANTTANELTSANGGIHANFRLFLTENPNRVQAHKLSGAFENRLITLHVSPLENAAMPKIDKLQNNPLAEGGLGLPTASSEALCGTDFVSAIEQQFHKIHGGRELAFVCGFFHLHVLKLVRAGKLRPVAESEISQRTLQRCVRAVRSATLGSEQKNVAPAIAVTSALVQDYVLAVEAGPEQEQLMTFLGDLIDSADVKKDFYEYPGPPGGHNQSGLRGKNWKTEEDSIVRAMRDVESACGRDIASALQAVRPSALDADSQAQLRAVLLGWLTMLAEPHAAADRTSAALCETLRGLIAEGGSFGSSSWLQIQQKVSELEKAVLQPNRLYRPDGMRMGMAAAEYADRAAALLHRCVRETSYLDAEKRHGLLVRVVAVVDEFRMKFLVPLRKIGRRDGKSKEAFVTTAPLDSVEATLAVFHGFRNKAALLKDLLRPELEDVKTAFQTESEEQENRSAVAIVQRELGKPVLDAAATLATVAEKLMDGNEVSMESLRRFIGAKLSEVTRLPEFKRLHAFAREADVDVHKKLLAAVLEKRAGMGESGTATTALDLDWENHAKHVPKHPFSWFWAAFGFVEELQFRSGSFDVILVTPNSLELAKPLPIDEDRRKGHYFFVLCHDGLSELNESAPSKSFSLSLLVADYSDTSQAEAVLSHYMADLESTVERNTHEELLKKFLTRNKAKLPDFPELSATSGRVAVKRVWLPEVPKSCRATQNDKEAIRCVLAILGQLEATWKEGADLVPEDLVKTLENSRAERIRLKPGCKPGEDPSQQVQHASAELLNAFASLRDAYCEWSAPLGDEPSLAEEFEARRKKAFELVGNTPCIEYHRDVELSLENVGTFCSRSQAQNNLSLVRSVAKTGAIDQLVPLLKGHSSCGGSGSESAFLRLHAARSVLGSCRKVASFVLEWGMRKIAGTSKRQCETFAAAVSESALLLQEVARAIVVKSERVLLNADSFAFCRDSFRHHQEQLLQAFAGLEVPEEILAKNGMYALFTGDDVEALCTMADADDGMVSNSDDSDAEMTIVGRRASFHASAPNGRSEILTRAESEKQALLKQAEGLLESVRNFNPIPQDLQQHLRQLLMALESCDATGRESQHALGMRKLDLERARRRLDEHRQDERRHDVLYRCLESHFSEDEWTEFRGVEHVETPELVQITAADNDFRALAEEFGKLQRSRTDEDGVRVRGSPLDKVVEALVQIGITSSRWQELLALAEELANGVTPTQVCGAAVAKMVSLASSLLVPDSIVLKMEKLKKELQDGKDGASGSGMRLADTYDALRSSLVQEFVKYRALLVSSDDERTGTSAVARMAERAKICRPADYGVVADVSRAFDVLIDENGTIPLLATLTWRTLYASLETFEKCRRQIELALEGTARNVETHLVLRPNLMCLADIAVLFCPTSDDLVMHAQNLQRSLDSGQPAAGIDASDCSSPRVNHDFGLGVPSLSDFKIVDASTGSHIELFPHDVCCLIATRLLQLAPAVWKSCHREAGASLIFRNVDDSPFMQCFVGVASLAGLITLVFSEPPGLKAQHVPNMKSTDPEIKRAGDAERDLATRINDLSAELERLSIEWKNCSNDREKEKQDAQISRDLGYRFSAGAALKRMESLDEKIASIKKEADDLQREKDQTSQLWTEAQKGQADCMREVCDRRRTHIRQEITSEMAKIMQQFFQICGSEFVLRSLAEGDGLLSEFAAQIRSAIPKLVAGLIRGGPQNNSRSQDSRWWLLPIVSGKMLELKQKVDRALDVFSVDDPWRKACVVIVAQLENLVNAVLRAFDRIKTAACSGGFSRQAGPGTSSRATAQSGCSLENLQSSILTTAKGLFGVIKTCGGDTVCDVEAALRDWLTIVPSVDALIEENREKKAIRAQLKGMRLYLFQTAPSSAIPPLRVLDLIDCSEDTRKMVQRSITHMTEDRACSLEFAATASHAALKHVEEIVVGALDSVADVGPVSVLLDFHQKVCGNVAAELDRDLSKINLERSVVPALRAALLCETGGLQELLHEGVSAAALSRLQELAEQALTKLLQCQIRVEACCEDHASATSKFIRERDLARKNVFQRIWGDFTALLSRYSREKDDASAALQKVDAKIQKLEKECADFCLELLYWLYKDITAAKATSIRATDATLGRARELIGKTLGGTEAGQHFLEKHFSPGPVQKSFVVKI
eukprot:g15531.t1